jgi:hypothetical protein
MLLGQEIFSSPKPSTRALGHTQRSFPEVEWPRHEVNYLLLVRRLRIGGAVPPHPSIYMVWRGIALPDTLCNLSVCGVLTLKGYFKGRQSKTDEPY